MTTLTDNERLREPGVEYIRKKLSDRVKTLQRSVVWYRRRHYITTLSAVLLSAAITVTAGLEGTWINGQITKNLVLVMGAMSTVMSAWGAFFSPREIQHLYVSTIGKIRGVESRLGLAVALGDGGQISAEEIKAFFNEYECIMKEHNSRWLEISGKSDVQETILGQIFDVACLRYGPQRTRLTLGDYCIFRSHNDDRPSKFIVLADNMKSVINKALEGET